MKSDFFSKLFYSSEQHTLSWDCAYASDCFSFVRRIKFFETDLSSLLNSINQQSEINLYSLKILTKIFVSFEIPLLNHRVSNFMVVFVQFMVVFLLKYWYCALNMEAGAVFFWKSIWSLYFHLYPLQKFFNLNTKSFHARFSHTLHPEFIELFICVLLLSEIILKKKRGT